MKTKDEILQVSGMKKHELAFALNQIGLSDQEIADATGFAKSWIRANLNFNITHPERIQKFNQKFGYLISE